MWAHFAFSPFEGVLPNRHRSRGERRRSVLRHFLATVDGFSDDDILLLVLPEKRRVRLRVSASFESLVRACIAEQVPHVFAVTAHGDELVNITRHLSREDVARERAGSSVRRAETKERQKRRC